MERRIAVVELEIPARDVDGLNIFRALEAAVELSREQPRLTTLSGVKVRRVRFPEPDVPTAAGEGEGGTRRILLSAEQSDRAERILQQDFVPPIQAYSLQVRTAPPTLTGVVYTSGQPHLVSHTLTEEEVLIILGPEES